MQIDTLEPRRLFALSFTPTTLDAGPAPVRIETGDFNNDGNADLVVVNVGNPTQFPGNTFGISLFLGNGDGTLQPRQIIRQSPDQDSTSLELLDLNRDGNLDIVTADAVLLGNGAGGFSTNTLTGTTEFVIGDFSGDGLEDRVYVDFSLPDPLALATGNGNGSFNTPTGFPVDDDLTSPTAASPLASPRFEPTAINSDGNNGNAQTLLEADVNKDGIADLIRIPDFQEQVFIYLGYRAPDTSLRFKPKSDIVTFQSLITKKVITADFAFILNFDQLYRSIFPFGLSTQTLSSSQPTPLGAAAVPAPPSGNLLFLDSSDGSISTTRFDDSGSLVDAINTYPLGSFPKSLDLGDLNNDGFVDLVIAENFSADITYLLGNGDGTFQPRVILPVGQRPNDALFVDLNNDGLTDIVNSNTFDDTLTIHLNTTSLGTPTGGSNGTDPLKAAAKVRLAAPGFTVKPNETFTLTATASGTAGAPTGTVRFFDGATLLGTSTTNANGIATLNLSLPAGTHFITAAFLGNDTYAPSVSPPITRSLSDITSPPPPPTGGGTLTVTGTPTTPIIAGTKLPSITIAPAAGTTIPKGAKLTPTIATGPANATFFGPKSAAFKKGTAVIKNLSFRTAGTYTLTFTSTAATLGSVTTSTFTIIPATPKRATFSSIPATLTPNATFTATVSLTDKFGNLVTTDNATPATLSFPGKAADFLKGTLTRTATAGLLTFDALSITTPGKYTLFAKPATKGISPAKTTITVS